MSRVGKQPITIPDAVTLEVKDGIVTAKGPKGELSVAINEELKTKLEDGTLTIERPSEEKRHREMHGLYRTLVSNIVDGVTEGFEKRLEIIGVGYRAEMKGKNLLLSVGFSHDILFRPTDDIEISIEGNNIIILP